MTEFIDNFHFLRPWWLLGLAAIPLLWRTFSSSGTDAGAWRNAVDAHLLRHLIVAGNSGDKRRLPRWLLATGAVIACLALAGPAWERLPQPLYRNGAARVIALQLSSSMSATDIKPSRYERARFKIDDILRRSADMQTALIAYAADAFVVAPLTDDVNTVTNLVDALDPSVMPADGDNTARAINLGVKLIRQSGQERGQIILVADAVSDNATAAARRARAAGIRVSVLGVGSEQGSPVVLPNGGFLKNSAGDIVLPKLDAASLATVAEAGGGRYATISADAGDIDTVLKNTLAQLAAGHARSVESTSSRFLDRGPWLVLLLLPIAAVGFRRGWLMLFPLALCLHARPAAAVSWSDLWQRPDQRARAALDAGHAKQAQAIARDPSLRGAAAYRAGDYKAAARAFSRRKSADALYNRGNALARQRHYRQAISAYELAMKQQPGMPDAVANKKAIENWLKKQQKKNQQGKSGSGDKNDDKQQSGSQDKSGEQPHNGQQQSSAGDQQKGTRNQSSDANDGKQKAQSAEQRQAERKAQQRFRNEMDRALKKQGTQKAPPPVRLGAREGGRKQNEQQQAVQQWLQRVPDDPGGLLRRKFQLEYQQRHHGESAPRGDDG